LKINGLAGGTEGFTSSLQDLDLQSFSSLAILKYQQKYQQLSEAGVC
jgi:hypothetical protein